MDNTGVIKGRIMKIVIMTCDKHSWIIPFFKYFCEKYWSDNPYQIEVVTETKHVDGAVFYAGKRSWRSMLIRYLKQSKEDKLLLMLEDCLINRIIDTNRVKFAGKLCEGNVGYVRLVNYPQVYFKRHTIKTNIEGFGEYPTWRRFGMITQDAIFQKEFLLDILREGESIWQTERSGTIRVGASLNKWRILWPEINIIDHPHKGILKKGELISKVVQWALSELSGSGEVERKLYKELRKR